SEVGLLRGLLTELPEAMRPVIFVAHCDENPAAAIVISLIGGTAFYLFGATGSVGRKSGGSYVLFWEAIKWMKSQNCRWFDLVGSRPSVTDGGEGYRRFKSGLTGKNGREVEMLDWDAGGSWLSLLTVQGGSILREFYRMLRHKMNQVRNRYWRV
ncbi:MAG: GNAT family N-acetyltransferase, partial [Woeseia sp.]